MADHPASSFGRARVLRGMFADRVPSFWFYPDVAPQLRISREAAQSYEQTG
jgi:hypothetical protein